MANVVVKDNHLTFGGVAYFRGHAEEVELGSIGEKRASLVKMNHLEVKDRIPVPKIKTAQTTVVDISFTRTSKNAFKTVVSAIIKGVPVKFSGDATFDKLKTGELKLVKFSVMNNDMRDAANASPKALNSLIEWGSKARIAHQIFVVMEASLASHYGNNATAELSVGKKGLEAKIAGKHSSSGSTTVEISAGTTFAYLLANPSWDARVKKNRTKITDLKNDQWSFG